MPCDPKKTFNNTSSNVEMIEPFLSWYQSYNVVVVCF